MSRFVMVSILVLLSTLTLSASAKAEFVRADFICPDGSTLTKEIPCLPGQTIQATGTCADGSKVQKSLICYKVPYLVLDWSVGVQGFFLDAADNGGVRGGGVEAVAGVFPSLGVKWLRLFTEFGVGGLFTEDNNVFAMTDAVGLQVRLDWGAVHVAGRHRIAILGDGDLINGVGGEVGLTFNLNAHWQLTISGTVGRAWFPIEVPGPTIYVPAGAPPVSSPTSTQMGDGIWGAAALGISYHF